MTNIERYHLPRQSELPRVLGGAYVDGRMTVTLTRLHERGPRPRVVTATYHAYANDGLPHFIKAEDGSFVESATVCFTRSFLGDGPLVPRFE